MVEKSNGFGFWWIKMKTIMWKPIIYSDSAEYKCSNLWQVQIITDMKQRVVSLFIQIVLWQFKLKTFPVTVLVMRRCGWCQSLHMMKKNHKIYGGSVAPPAEAHKTRWRPRWPPKIICLNVSGTIRDRTIIYGSIIWFSGTGNSKNIFLILPEDHVTLQVKVIWKNWSNMVNQPYLGNHRRYNHYSDVYYRVLKKKESSKHIFEIVWRSRDLGSQGNLTKLVE